MSGVTLHKEFWRGDASADMLQEVVDEVLAELSSPDSEAAQAAQAAGLSAADVLVAIGGLRTNARNLEKRLAQYKPGERVVVHGFRRDELFERSVVLQGAPTDTCSLAVSGTDATSRRRREHWLGRE